MSKRMVEMSPEAEAQFLEAIAYIAERNPSAAEKIVAKMRACAKSSPIFLRAGSVAKFPELGG